MHWRASKISWTHFMHSFARQKCYIIELMGILASTNLTIEHSVLQPPACTDNKPGDKGSKAHAEGNNVIIGFFSTSLQYLSFQLFVVVVVF